MRSGLGVAVALAFLAVSERSDAAEIRWSGSADCRREQEVVDPIESMTGRALTTIDRRFRAEPNAHARRSLAWSER